MNYLNEEWAYIEPFLDKGLPGVAIVDVRGNINFCPYQEWKTFEDQKEVRFLET